jgi:hypothetical protein
MKVKLTRTTVFDATIYADVDPPIHQIAMYPLGAGAKPENRVVSLVRKGFTATGPSLHACLAIHTKRYRR